MKENLVGVGVANSIKGVGIREHPLQRSILGLKSTGELVERHGQNIDPIAPMLFEALPTTNKEDRCPLLGAHFL